MARPTPGARSTPPSQTANPAPQVGSKPNEKPNPENGDGEIELNAPPALQPAAHTPGEKMIKVETTGNFMIQDPTTLDEVPHDKPNTVRRTTYIENAIEDGRLKEV